MSKVDLSALTTSQLAVLTGVKLETVSKRLRERGIAPIRSDGRAHFFDPRTALPIALGRSSATAEKARLDAARADLAEQELSKRSGELIETSEVKQRWAGMALSWKERIRSVPVVALSRVPGFTKAMAKPLAELIDSTLIELADNAPPRKRGA